VAKKQETIRYYDIKEFQQERDTKRLYVELKNSETRWRAIEKMNLTYKYVIDQLLHDSLFYQPVLDALNDDCKEQARLVQEAYNIGAPTIKHVKKIEKRVQKLAIATKRDEERRFPDLMQHRLALKQHPKKVKELVRRDVMKRPLQYSGNNLLFKIFSQISSISMTATHVRHLRWPM
jgi:hypothetical protein